MTMRERVARAICLSRDTCQYCNGRCLAAPSELRASAQWVKAGAAIAAMREPTPLMKYAGGQTEDEHVILGWDPTEVWQAMIDTALKEPE